MDIYYLALYFFVYGFLGWCTEVAFAACKEHRFVNRGFLNGPICPIYGVGVTAVVALLNPFRENIVLLYILSTVLVTVLEGLTGWAMDKIFHNKWWDYSNMPFNIGGYVCLLFSLIWGVACVVVMKFIHPVIHDILTFIPYRLGLILLVMSGAALFIDLYVTASTIFRFNRRLAGMEKIAAEMHEISDKIGQEIYENTIYAMELQETSRQKMEETAGDVKEKTQETISEIQKKTETLLSEIQEKKQDAVDHSLEISEEIRTQIAQLRIHYKRLDTRPDLVSRRLLNAFPHMESRNAKEQLNKVKEKWMKK